MTDRFATLRHGLVGAWCPSLGATGYTLLDRSGFARNGTLTNMDGLANWVASRDGVALSFARANSSHIRMAPRPTTGTETLAFSCWFYKASGTSGFHALFSIGNNNNQPVFEVGIRETGRLYFYRDLGSLLEANTSPTLDVWNHVAFVLVGGSAGTWYLNGVEAGTVTAITTYTRTLTDQFIGTDGTVSVNDKSYWNGYIDDVRLYGRALTVAEIRLLASRRGIGLLPTRHRRAKVLGSQFWLRQSGEWKKATTWINVGGTWKTATPKLNVSGTWK